MHRAISFLGLFALFMFSRPASLFAADQGDIAIVEDTTGEINNGIALPNVYLAKATCAFFQTHQDKYDAVFVFTTIPQNFLTNVQQGWPVKQVTTGIGRLAWDQTTDFCAASGRLRQAVKMGDLAILPDDTEALYTGIPFYPLSGIQLLAHEFGHHWLAAVRFDKGDGQGLHCLLRGYEPSVNGSGNAGDCDGLRESDFNQHWSVYFNSGSLMYGSMISDLGGGMFKLYYDQPKYSPLDQYLMGIRDQSEVPPLFVVSGADLANSGSSSLPLAPGQSKVISGQRLDFTVEDVIRAEGPRAPASEACHWTAAFILIHQAGKPPTAAEINKVNTYRTRWESFYAWATDGRGSFDTTLDNRGKPTCSSPPKPDASVARDLSSAEGMISVDHGVADSGAKDTRGLDRSLDETRSSEDLVGSGSGCGCTLATRPIGECMMLTMVLGLALLMVRRK